MLAYGIKTLIITQPQQLQDKQQTMQGISKGISTLTKNLLLESSSRFSSKIQMNLLGVL